MNHIVTLNLGKGSLDDGFPIITAQLRDRNGSVFMQLTGSLPPAPELAQLHQRWRRLYRLFYETYRPKNTTYYRTPTLSTHDIEIDEDDETRFSDREFDRVHEELQEILDRWLSSDGFLNIDRGLRENLDLKQEIVLILETECDRVKALPWHLWSFLIYFPKLEIAIASRDYRRIEPVVPMATGTVKILAVLGNSRGIDVECDRKILQDLPDAETVFLVEPTLDKLRDRLTTDRYDIFFFAGHGQTEDNTGQIWLNSRDCLEIAQLKDALRSAIARGLKIAIFNSCDGLGLVKELEELNLPQTIVMAEPVPDRSRRTAVLEIIFESIFYWRKFLCFSGKSSEKSKGNGVLFSLR